MCGRKGPGARTRGRRRHPRKLGGTPPRSPGGARAAEETAYPLAPRSPRGSRWGRWSEGVLTRPKPQAARYPAGCPPLSAAKCGEAEEACPNVSRGFGGMCPPSLPSCDEGEAKLPISARYLRAWAAQASRGTQPSPPLSCGVARRWQRRALPTCEAGGRAVSGGAGGPAGAAAPEELLLAGKNDAGTQRSCGQRGLLAPRYPARGAGRCRGAVSARYPAGVRPGRDGFLRRRPSGEARLRCRVPRRYPAAAAPVRGSRPLLRPLSCGRGGGDRGWGVFDLLKSRLL